MQTPLNTPTETAAKRRVLVIVSFILGGLALLFILLFILNLFGFSQYAFYQPRVTAVQNSTFHQSQQYKDGKLNALRQYEVQYANASSDAARASIRAMVRDEFASYDVRNLEGHPDLQAFLHEMEGNP